MKEIFFILCISVLCANCFSQNNFKVLKSFPVSGNGWWDYIAVHENNIYTAHGTQVNINDKNTGAAIAVINSTSGVHGIAFDDETGKGFTSNGKLNNVFVFDLKTNKVIDSIATGQGPDAIMYEPFTKKIITCNGHSNDLSIIDPVTNKLVATIPLKGKPETAVSNGEGKLYVNDEDNGNIIVVDLKTFSVEANWSLNGGEAPTGLVYDAATKRLFAGCDNNLLVAVDATNGKVISRVAIGSGCDGVAFNAESQTIFTSNGEDGTITVIKENSGKDLKVVETITTQISARTIIEDPATHLLYLPAAAFEAGAAQGQRPKIVEGSFKVIVVGVNK